MAFERTPKKLYRSTPSLAVKRQSAHIVLTSAYEANCMEC